MKSPLFLRNRGTARGCGTPGAASPTIRFIICLRDSRGDVGIVPYVIIH